MRLVGKKLLRDFREMHVDARSQIESWEAEVREAQWGNPHELKMRFPKASLVKNQRVVFDICRNRYRLLVQINYKNGIVLVQKIDTHRKYDKWNLI